MKYIKVVCSAILVFIFLLSGCTKIIKYTYKGNNDLWTAEYRVEGADTSAKIKDGRYLYESDIQYVFEAVYKGDLEDLSSAKSIEISQHCSKGGGTLRLEGSEVNSNKFTMMTLSSGTFPSEDEIIEVTINVDGDIQTFEIKK